MEFRKSLWLILGLIVLDQLLHSLWGFSESLLVNPEAQRWFGLLPSSLSYVLACGGLLALFYYNPPQNKWTKLGFSLAFAGALSNLITEVRYGQVVDYFIMARWVVNFADGMVMVGLGLILLSLISKK